MTQDEREEFADQLGLSSIEVIREIRLALVLQVDSVSAYRILDAIASDNLARFDCVAVFLDTLADAACYHPVALISHSWNGSSSSFWGALSLDLAEGVKPNSASRFKHRSANLWN